MKHFFTLIITVFIFTGCFKQPDIPSHSFAMHDKIGYLIDIQKYPVHTHIGTTVFNNFTKTYPLEWNLESFAEMQLLARLDTGTFELVNLKETNLSKTDLENIVIADDGEWQINPEKQALADKLQHQLGLKSIIVIYDGQSLPTIVTTTT